MNGAAEAGTRALGPVSSCLIDLPEGLVCIEGADGPDAHLGIRYLDRPATASDDPVRDGVVIVEQEHGRLAIRSEVGERPGLGGLQSAARRTRVAVDLRLPRDARVEAATVGGDVRTVGIEGGQVVSTVTGAVTVTQASGEVDARTVSGAIDLGGEALDVQAATTSGSLRVAASGIDTLRARSVSGHVDVRGRLTPGREHRIESVSGDVVMTAEGGTTVAFRTLSGQLRGGPDVRRDLRQGLPALVLGDGAAVVHVKTVSGDTSLASGGAGGRVSGDHVPAGEPAPGTGDPMLDALEALARGEISVEETGRRLEALHG